MRIIFDLENYRLHDLLLDEFGKDSDLTEHLEASLALYLERTFYVTLAGTLLWKIRGLGVNLSHRVVRYMENHGVVEYRSYAKTLHGITIIKSIRYAGDRTFVVTVV